MKTQPIKYKIANGLCNWSRLTVVDGFAVDSPYRFCIRLTGGMWQADDYDTGFRVGGHHFTQDDCINEAIARIERQPPGHYVKCQQAALAGLKKVGLL